ncbi:Ku protein [Rhizobium sp. BK251]|uniref:non-homologous end joining protein Ku n=1 Tax=Rhizobium sp. BK251 TaxID=2512125 RepID=UPI00104580E8|nr:Ku protein [Rhizobium sp. BK251]TCL68316.1 DNA end-binding protein Ku [Rhizobium sp. BK251]
MAARASWKGYLKVGELSCAIALYSATSSSERLSFHIINRRTGHRVERQFVDSETGEPVGRDDQVKGFRQEGGDYLMIEGDEIAAAAPDGDKTLTIEDFIAYDDIDKLYFDRPYYLAPADDVQAEVLGLLMQAMQQKKVAALARAVLFRRYRTLLIRPHGDELVATTLNFDYEVRSARDAFKQIGDVRVTGEMLDLAGHIIKTKLGNFDPAAYEDRYEAALVELVRAKIEGRLVSKKRPRAERKVIDLMEALRESAKLGATTKAPKKPARNKDSRQKKAS